MIAGAVKKINENGNFSILNGDQLFRRFLKVDEVAGLIGYLLGDESKFITKASYEISAGFSA
jgi:hypothetical protein